MAPTPTVRYIRHVHQGKVEYLKQEYVDAQLSRVQYRDAKGRLCKFTSKKKLKAEVIFTVKRGTSKSKRVVSTSYGLPLRQRKKPIPESVILRQIHRKHQAKRERGVTITQFYDPTMNLYRWTYAYLEKTQAQKEAARKKRREKKRKTQKAMAKKKAERIVKKMKKGSRRGY